ncbi:MAG: hypothetical protein ACI9N9_000015 [Enterobacterales bacterium]|jgi:hypothetical protein
MNEDRRNELDKLIAEYTKEFRENANTEGRFGALYLSCDSDTDNVQMSLECAREPFIRMIASLMAASDGIAEDIIKAVEQYEPRDPLNLKAIAG